MDVDNMCAALSGSKLFNNLADVTWLIGEPAHTLLASGLLWPLDDQLRLGMRFGFEDFVGRLLTQ